MRTRTIATILLATLVLLPPLALAADDPAKGAWENLKKMTGEWEGEAEGQKATVAYKLTGAGTTLMETMFPGTPHEMVSMYHMDKSDLVMTHYCAVGNQPHLKFDPAASKPDLLVFKFASGSNMDPSKDSHIHGLVVRLVDADHVEHSWEHYKDGKAGEGLKYMLTRKK